MNLDQIVCDEMKERFFKLHKRFPIAEIPIHSLPADVSAFEVYRIAPVGATHFKRLRDKILVYGEM